MMKQKSRAHNANSGLNNAPYDKKKTGVEFQYQMMEFVIPRKSRTMQVDVEALTNRVSEKLL